MHVKMPDLDGIFLHTSWVDVTFCTYVCHLIMKGCCQMKWCHHFFDKHQSLKKGQLIVKASVRNDREA